MKRMKAEKDEEKKKSKMNKEDKKKFEQEQKQKQLNDLGRRGKGKVRYLIKNQILLHDYCDILLSTSHLRILFYDFQKTPQDEEREIHESYQILLLEYHAKKALREKKAREKLKASELKAKENAEAEKLKMEQDKMRNEMDKFFDASGSVVSPQISLVFLFLLKVFLGQ